MNKDGMRDGYSIDLLNELGDICDIPMIASGGAGNINHFIDVFTSTKVDGALAASIFHKQIYSINDVKSVLLANNINIRL
jgi:cyclase